MGNPHQMNRKVKIGTRGSELALFQANYIKDQLKALKVTCEVKRSKHKAMRYRILVLTRWKGRDSLPRSWKRRCSIKR